MKKRIIIILIPIILILMVFAWKIISDNKKENHYQKIKDDLKEDIERVLKIVHPHCEVGNGSFSMLFEEEQNDYYGIDKKKLIDVDGKSYCKVRVKAKCISTDNLTWDAYVKCKDYEDEGYNIEKEYTGSENSQ